MFHFDENRAESFHTITFAVPETKATLSVQCPQDLLCTMSQLPAVLPLKILPDEKGICDANTFFSTDNIRWRQKQNFDSRDIASITFLFEKDKKRADFFQGIIRSAEGKTFLTKLAEGKDQARTLQEGSAQKVLEKIKKFEDIENHLFRLATQITRQEKNNLQQKAHTLGLHIEGEGFPARPVEQLRRPATRRATATQLLELFSVMEPALRAEEMKHYETLSMQRAQRTRAYFSRDERQESAEYNGHFVSAMLSAAVSGYVVSVLPTTISSFVPVALNFATGTLIGFGYEFCRLFFNPREQNRAINYTRVGLSGLASGVPTVLVQILIKTAEIPTTAMANGIATASLGTFGAITARLGIFAINYCLNTEHDRVLSRRSNPVADIEEGRPLILRSR